MTKMYLSVLCMVLLVSQIEMAPVDPVTTLELKQDSKTIDVEEMQNVGTKLISADLNKKLDSHSYVKTVLSRLKRNALANTRYNRCPNGRVELWRGGLCGTCEQYMDLHDTADCPVEP